MSDNTIIFTGETKVDLPVDTILDGAKNGDLESAIVIGVGAKDDEIHIYSTSSAKANMLGLLLLAGIEIINA